MILSEKGPEFMYPPPPPYDELASTWNPPPPPFRVLAAQTHTKPSTNASNAQLSAFPSHLLLQIIWSTFPQEDGRYEGEGKFELQRANLFWLETGLRLVNKAFNTTCMHVLRSTYIPAYDSLIRPPYSSNPFFSPCGLGSNVPSRELATLDQFIALLAHEDVLLDSSELYLPREEAYKDLFDLAQPRSRLEDLIIHEGIQVGVVASGLTSDNDISTQSQETMSTAGNCEPSQPEASDDATEEESKYSTLMPPPSPLSPLHPTNSHATPSPSPTRSTFKPFAFVSSLKEKHAKKKEPPPPTPFVGTAPTTSCTPPAQTTNCKSKLSPLPHRAISIQFSPRAVKLMYSDGAGISSGGGDLGSEFGSLSLSQSARKKWTLAEIGRPRDETLEATAKRLVVALWDALEEGLPV